MKVEAYQWEPSTLDIARRAGIDPAQVIRFDQNTCPVSPAWAAELAAETTPTLNEYPNSDYLPLRRAIAAYTGMGPDGVVVGAGADELIDLCAKAFLPSGGTAVTAPPTYSMYKVATSVRGADLVEVSRRSDFALNAEAVSTASARADLVWLCVPNNPTGDRDPDQAIRRVLEAAAGVVVVDAAYAEFCGDQWAAWVGRHSNLVVLGTLSKAFGLAGIRVGYALAAPELADALNARRPPGSISTLSAVIAEQALARPERAAGTVASVTAAREVLAASLEELGLATHPSVCNFVISLVGLRAREIADDLTWKDGLVVRSFPHSSTLEFYLRFTVRSRPEHERLLEALERRLA